MALLSRSIQSQIAGMITVVFVIGGLLNKFSGHEWAPLRTTDLYSQSPSSKNYRAFIGKGHYVLLSVDESVWDNGDREDALPGVQVPDEATAQALIKSIQDGPTGESSPEMITDPKVQEFHDKLAALHLTLDEEPYHAYLTVMVRVSDGSCDWWEYATSTQPRLSVTAYESRGEIYKKLDPNLWSIVAPWKPKDSDYQDSIVYWMLMGVPILLLGFDLRPFGPSSKTAREALFRPFSSHTGLLFKRYLADVFFEWVTLDGANRFFQIPRCNAIVLLLITLLDTWGLQRRLNNRFAMAASCAIKVAGIVGVTIMIYNTEHTYGRRYSTAHLQIEAQLTLGNLVAQALALYYGPEYYETLEAAFHKIVLTLHFYTASASKMGEAGLRWIDDRYIAQLALRGQFGGGGKYPLADVMVHQPPLFRACGMFAVLTMELSAVFSWWTYGAFVRVWVLFMIMSTLTIGVPLAPGAFGPLEGLLRRITVWGVVVVGVAFILALSFVKVKRCDDVRLVLRGRQKEKIS